MLDMFDVCVYKFKYGSMCLSFKYTLEIVNGVSNNVKSWVIDMCNSKTTFTIFNKCVHNHWNIF